ncbi:hypothetical protein PCANB_002277 [Pneumocystis canis]|nr:hypothetical protein PCANB_002277 [Pneumocystis canis]
MNEKELKSSDIVEGEKANRIQSKRMKRIPYGPQTEEYSKILAWQSQENEFVLSQAKKRSELRVRHGRGTPIDFLAVHLRIVDTVDGISEERPEHAEVVLYEPVKYLETLDISALQALEENVAQYLKWETCKDNLAFWEVKKGIIQEDSDKEGDDGRFRLSLSIETQVDALLQGKTMEELEVLEKQINEKLHSGTVIDVDYWEKMKQCLILWKAKITLKTLHERILKFRREALRNQQLYEARMDREMLKNLFNKQLTKPEYHVLDSSIHISDTIDQTVVYQEDMDPKPLSALTYNDKKYLCITVTTYQDQLAANRNEVLNSGFVPLEIIKPVSSVVKQSEQNNQDTNDDSFAAITNALYEREVAKGENDDEELFNIDEEIVQATPSWADIHRPRKPKFYNRVQTGYDWNRYNQVHYDANNPPPKMVQGYKFNIFYPDLIDKTKAPTYRIERNQKKPGDHASVSEDETCLIRFIAGAPYEDIAFRIIDKDWDYSAKRERGFRSSFDKGVLHLSFQFKKVFYRK